MKDYYTLLNVSPSASHAQIDAAYRRLMQRHHPNARSSPQALDRMRELNEAWRVLSDENQRAVYDRARENGVLYQPPSPPPTLRNIPQASLADFGARRSSGGTCLVGIGVALVLLFSLGILMWGLDEQLNFNARFNQAVGEVSALLPTSQASPTEAAEDEITPTPDPRCRDGCETPPPGCVVKGDIENDGTRYFYLPNDFGYGQVNIDISSGDRWFCALNDAQAAGWTRKAPTETPTAPPPPEAFTTGVARRNFSTCAENAAIYSGPGDDFPVVRTVPAGTRLAITGVNGDWSVFSDANGTFYILTTLLCIPTRAPAQPTRATTPNAPSADTHPATPTPIVANAATSASAAAGNFKYAAPQILVPTNGAKYWCNRELVLQWAFNTQLAPDEFFLVEHKLVEHDRWVALYDWTKESSVILYPNRGGGSCDTVWWSNTGVYEWRVSVVSGNKETPTYLSPFSQAYRINYSQ